MPVALGTSKRTAIDVGKFNNLWDALDDGMRSKSRVWQELSDEAQREGGQLGVTLLRLAVADRLVESLATDQRRLPTEANLANAARLLAAVFATTPPPSEAQFVQWLNRDLPKPDRRADPALIQLALQTRRQAEQL